MLDEEEGLWRDKGGRGMLSSDIWLSLIHFLSIIFIFIISGFHDWFSFGVRLQQGPAQQMVSRKGRSLVCTADGYIWELRNLGPGNNNSKGDLTFLLCLWCVMCS
jgi:hypothetical protein